MKLWLSCYIDDQFSPIIVPIQLIEYGNVIVVYLCNKLQNHINEKLSLNYIHKLQSIHKTNNPDGLYNSGDDW